MKKVKIATMGLDDFLEEFTGGISEDEQPRNKTSLEGDMRALENFRRATRDEIHTFKHGDFIMQKADVLIGYSYANEVLLFDRYLEKPIHGLDLNICQNDLSASGVAQIVDAKAITVSHNNGGEIVTWLVDSRQLEPLDLDALKTRRELQKTTGNA